MDDRKYQSQCVIFARSASACQQDYDLEKQVSTLRVYARDHGMICVGEERLWGVSADSETTKAVLKRLMERKVRDRDFDTLLAVNLSRFTRRPQDKSWIEQMLSNTGIKIVLVGGEEPGTETNDGILTDLRCWAAKTEQRMRAQHTRSAMARAIESGRIPHTTNAPYGVDKLYVTTGGKKLYILREVGDGTQVQLNPVDGRIVCAFAGPNFGNAQARHRKPLNAVVRFVPGATEAVTVVRTILRKWAVDEWDCTTITDHLNLLGARPCGDAWSTKLVNRIVRNPIYIGRGYYQRQRSRISRSSEASTDWIEVVYPELENAFVSGDVRRIVNERLLKAMSTRLNGGVK